MTVIADYQVDKDLYDISEHQISLVTTEYTYRNDMLVHLQVGKNLAVRLNNLLDYAFKTDTVFSSEQFLFKKPYSRDKTKLITRSIFKEKMKQFDMSQTVTEQEILEEYFYRDKEEGSLCETRL